MLELSLEQQLELARRTYPGRKVSSSLYGSEHRVLVEMEGEFKPSLTGNQQYRAQACDVIVAAVQLVAEGKIRGIEIRNHPIFKPQITVLPALPNADYSVNDLLHASALALLGDKT